ARRGRQVSIASHTEIHQQHEHPHHGNHAGETMGSWRARASVASLAGACLFAVTTGAGAVFVGDWWGPHHGSAPPRPPPPAPSPPAVAAHPGTSPRRAQASEAAHNADADADADADAG